MDLKKEKTVMIVILIAINAFFAYNIVSHRYNEEYIDATTIQNAIEILSHGGIQIEPDTLPNKKISMPIYESRFFDSYNEKVVKILSGSETEKTFSLPDGMRFVAKNGDTVEMSDGFEIVFLSSEANKYIAFYRIVSDVAILDRSSLSDDILEPIKKKLISDASAVVGYAETGAECTAVYFDAVSGYHVAVFSQMMDGVPIYGNDLFCVIDSEKLLYMEGLWSFLPTDAKYSSQLTDQINILFMEKNRVDDEREKREDVLSEEADHTAELKIDKLDNVYCTYFNEDKTGFFFVPAWRITYDDGTEAVYDAQSGVRYIEVK